MKPRAWMLAAACAIAASGIVACGQQLVDLPYEENGADMGAGDQAIPIVIEHDMAHPVDAGDTD